MIKALHGLHPLIFLLIAAALEVGGDAVIRIGLFQHTGPARGAVLIGGALLLLAYGTVINLAPLEFGQVVGLYVAVLLIVWQVINFVVFRTLPTAPILVGGALVIVGGAIITFWKGD